MDIYRSLDTTSADWQIIEILWNGAPQEYVYEMEIAFYLFADDSSYIGANFVLNNLKFAYVNGDTIVVDNFGDDEPNSVEPLPDMIPTEFNLFQNYPNPFNPTTTLRYEMVRRGQVRLEVYDLLGQLIATLIDEELPAGVYETPFDGTGLSSGTYIYSAI
jgi:hypothetical protein